MPGVDQEACPLCNLNSDFEYVVGDAKKRQHFYCEQCIEFVITSTAKRKLSGKVDKLKELSKLAASLNDDEVLHIFFEGHGIQHPIEKKKDWL